MKWIRIWWDFTKQSWAFVGHWEFFTGYWHAWKHYKLAIQLAEANVTIVPKRNRKQYVKARKAARKNNREIRNNVVS